MRFRLHKLFHPFAGFFLNLAYLTKLSEWRAQHSGHPINDFYSGKWDYSKRYILYQKIVEKENLGVPINYLEFGVSKGSSFKWWAEHNKNEASRFFGFDTFTGLPEDWNVFKAGAMSAEGKFPEINDSRTKFLKGLFQDTLPAFLKDLNNDKRKIIHLDADLYTSTLYVLTMLHPYLKAGDILFFDEFAVPQHEFLAFKNFVDSYRVSYEVLGTMNNYFFVAVKIL
ncbi:MAG: class I SAM-dependent methyltransferase [Bacteroidia bacterium]